MGPDPSVALTQNCRDIELLNYANGSPNSILDRCLGTVSFTKQGMTGRASVGVVLGIFR